MSIIDERELMEAIRDANYHRKGGVRCLRLFQLEPDFFRGLQTDVKRLCATGHASNVRDPHHITNWTRPTGDVSQYSLLNATGRYDDFSSDHNLSCFGKHFHEADLYPMLACFIAGFPHAVNFRINVLGHDAALSPHEEHAIVRTNQGNVGIRPRFHLPIDTNSGAEVVLDGEVYQLEEGTVYFVNHGCIHSARNRGDQPRTHLVWDLLLTREAYDLMFGDNAEIPFPARRVTLSERHPYPQRTERVEYARRIPELVAENEAHALTFFEIQ